MATVTLSKPAPGPLFTYVFQGKVVMVSAVRGAVQKGFEVVSLDGEEIGFITKTKNTRDYTHPYKAHLGIGMLNSLVGFFWNNADFVADKSPVVTNFKGGKKAAVAAIVAAHLKFKAAK